MEPPISFNADSVHDEQSKILHAIQPMNSEEVIQRAVRGQYGEGQIKGEKVPGYRTEQDVPPESRTETFVALKLMIDNWRWAGVPFSLRTGRRLAPRRTEVPVHLHRTPFALSPPTPLRR